jgi:hypothetical protein
MSVEAIEDSIIELFKEVNEPFYTKFIEPLRDKKNLTNVIGIFLHRPDGFTREELSDILFGVVDKLGESQLDLFNNSVSALIDSKYVNKEGKTQNLDKTPLSSLPGLKNASGTPLDTRLQYADIEWLIHDQYNELKNYKIDVEQQVAKAWQRQYLNAQKYDINELINKVKDSKRSLVESIYNSLSDNQTPLDERISFIKEILDLKKYDQGDYENILESLLAKSISEEEIKHELKELQRIYRVLSTTPQTIPEFEEYVEIAKERVRNQTPRPNRKDTQAYEGYKQKTLAKAKKLLTDTKELESGLKKGALARNKFGKRRRSYRKRKVTKKLRPRKRRSKKKILLPIRK